MSAATSLRPAEFTAYLVAWTSHKNGQGVWHDAGIYSEETPTTALDGSRGYAFTIARVISTKSYARAKAKLLLDLNMAGGFDRLCAFPSFRRAVTL